MAESVYSGLQGHGKSYEVVRGVIVPNVAKGRRIVTNVAGLQIDKIKAYCVEKLKADPDKLGEIVNISNEDVTKPEFFPVENADNSKCIVQGGDVVILDECWRWYVSGEKAPNGHLTFFRMHRHFLDPESGQCCDIVLIVQDINDLQRQFRATVEKSFLMWKHKDLGLTNHYSITIYSGKKQVKSAIIEQVGPIKYDPEIFALYSSYSQGGGAVAKEDQADKRGNFLKTKKILLGIPLGLLFIVAGAWKGYAFFHPASLEKKEVVRVDGGTSTPGQTGATAPEKPKSEVSDQWRVVGKVVKAGTLTFVVADAQNRLRYITNPPAFQVTPMEVALKLPSGEMVTYWSGSEKSVTAGVPGVKK